jgi:hypothetical protein
MFLGSELFSVMILLIVPNMKNGYTLRSPRFELFSRSENKKDTRPARRRSQELFVQSFP